MKSMTKYYILGNTTPEKEWKKLSFFNRFNIKLFSFLFPYVLKMMITRNDIKILEEKKNID